MKVFSAFLLFIAYGAAQQATPALNGKAIRKQVSIYLSKDKSWPSINLLIYLPAAAKKPAPMFLSINFGAVSNAVDDPGIKQSEVWDPKTNTKMPAPKGRGFGRLNVEPLLDAGIRIPPSFSNAANWDAVKKWRTVSAAASATATSSFSITPDAVLRLMTFPS